MSYLTSLNPQVFQNIAYLGSFKHFVLICFTCIFATRPSPALTAVVYIIYDVQIGISALSLYIRHLYISPSPPDGFPHVANSQLKQGLRGRVRLGQSGWVGLVGSGWVGWVGSVGSPGLYLTTFVKGSPPKNGSN